MLRPGKAFTLRISVTWRALTSGGMHVSYEASPYIDPSFPDEKTTRNPHYQAYVSLSVVFPLGAACVLEYEILLSDSLARLALFQTFNRAPARRSYAGEKGGLMRT